MPVLSSPWGGSLQPQPTSEQKWESRQRELTSPETSYGPEIHTIISFNSHFCDGGAGIAILQMRRLRLLSHLSKAPQKEAVVW